MTIRRRFTYSFLGILTLFAFNVIVYSWSSQKRATAVDDLRRAIQRQALLASVQLTLNDPQKHVSVLSQVATEAGASGASAPDKEQFAKQLEDAEISIGKYHKLLSGATPTAEDFHNSFRQLSASWRVFY